MNVTGMLSKLNKNTYIVLTAVIALQIYNVDYIP